jgi:hypothetical protein
MKRSITTLVVALSALAFAGSAQATARRSGSTGVQASICRAPFKILSRYKLSGTYDAVTVTNRVNMTCSTALHIAAKADSLSGLRVIYNPSEFGAGGWGGPFHEGRYHCWVLTRGSDFIHAMCWLGRTSVTFTDHRQYWGIPTPGWNPPALNP